MWFIDMTGEVNAFGRFVCIVIFIGICILIGVSQSH